MRGKNMEKAKVNEFIATWLEGTGCYLTDLVFDSDNNIVVEIDSDKSISIDTCVALTRAFEAAFPREVEDYNLEVGSAGLTSPLKVPAQFRKNIGNEVEVLTKDGRKLHALLTEADDAGFTVEWERKVKLPEQKKPVLEAVTETFPYTEVKSVVYDLKF